MGRGRGSVGGIWVGRGDYGEWGGFRISIGIIAITFFFVAVIIIILLLIGKGSSKTTIKITITLTLFINTSVTPPSTLFPSPLGFPQIPPQQPRPPLHEHGLQTHPPILASERRSRPAVSWGAGRACERDEGCGGERVFDDGSRDYGV